MEKAVSEVGIDQYLISSGQKLDINTIYLWTHFIETRRQDTLHKSPKIEIRFAKKLDRQLRRQKQRENYVNLEWHSVERICTSDKGVSTAHCLSEL